MGSARATQRSYELIAQHVMPHFQGSARRPAESKAWVSENRPTFMGAAGAAIMTAIAKHGEEQAAKESALDAEIEQIEQIEEDSPELA